MNVRVGVRLGVAGLAWTHTVLLLTEQSGGLSRPVVGAGRGRGLLGFGGGGLRWVGVKSACTHGGRRGLGERVVVAWRGGGLWQRLARSAAGGGRGQRGAAARRRRRLSARQLAPHGRRGQRQWVAGPWWRHGGQRDRRVQASVTAVWGLRRAVQPGRQEAVLVLSTCNLRSKTSIGLLVDVLKLFPHLTQ